MLSINYKIEINFQLNVGITMLRKFFKNVANNISIQNGYTENQREQIEYTLTSLSFEFIKIILLLLCFAKLGYFKESVIIIVIMSFTKPFIGGYHEDTQVRCFIFSFIILLSIILLNENCHIDFTSNIILNIFSIYCIWNQAPIVSPKMPITRDDLIKRNRYIGITTSLLFSLLSILSFSLYNFSNIITWTILIQAMLMFNKRS